MGTSSASKYRFGKNELPHLRFPVAWYNPAVLYKTLQELLSSEDQLRKFDRRELFSGHGLVPLRFGDDVAAHADFVWDFVSDTGDGGNATYAVALAAQHPRLELGFANGVATLGQAVPSAPGSLLVFGGDMAYPGASSEEYQYRFFEPWEAARPEKHPSGRGVAAQKKRILAISQNHDWFDNASTFYRYFVREDLHDDFLDAELPQNRSYFIAQLPRDWWVIGLDFALTGDIDRVQYDALIEVVSQQLSSQSNVILIYPEPFWTRPLGDEAREGFPKRYQRLEAKIFEIAKIRLRIAGDLHHYVREEAQSGDLQPAMPYTSMLIVCGTGGAFLHPTHGRRQRLPTWLDFSPDENALVKAQQARQRVGKSRKAWPKGISFARKCAYPNESRSFWLSCKNMIVFFRFANQGWTFSKANIANGNAMFLLVLGIAYVGATCFNRMTMEVDELDVFLKSDLSGFARYLHFLGQWLERVILSPISALFHVVVALACGALSREDGRVAFTFGVLHGLTHLLLAATIFYLCSHELLLVTLTDSYAGKWLTLVLVTFFVGMFAGGLLFGLYLTIVSALGFLPNEGFSTLGEQQYKGFLRLRIDPQGNLYGFMLGTDDVPRRWQTNDNPEPQGCPGLWCPTEKEAKKARWQVQDVFCLSADGRLPR